MKRERVGIFAIDRATAHSLPPISWACSHSGRRSQGSAFGSTLGLYPAAHFWGWEKGLKNPLYPSGSDSRVGELPAIFSPADNISPLSATFLTVTVENDKA